MFKIFQSINYLINYTLENINLFKHFQSKNVETSDNDIFDSLNNIV
jgi:hypothetical protein